MKARILFAALGLATLAGSLPACSLGDVNDGPDAAPPPPPVTPPPPPPVQPPPPSAATYVRGSMKPLFQLTPQREFNRFEIFGETMSVGDFQSNATVNAADQKILAVQQILSQERGENVDLVIDDENLDRATLIPFRGNPTDVDIIDVDGLKKAYVPLGGDMTTPGFEIAAVNLANNSVRRIPVGIRPQRTFALDGENEDIDLVFVCNQFSNYISVIDARFDELLERPDGTPVEIKTDFWCTDLLAVTRNVIGGEEDELALYVANQFRGSVLKYNINLVRDNNDDIEDITIVPPPSGLDHLPALEITGVGRNPFRLTLSDDEQEIFVTNNRGGEVSRFLRSNDQVTNRIAINAASGDIVQIQNKVFVVTTTTFRGYPSDNAGALPDDIEAEPVFDTGLDGEDHQIHPGATFDATDSYNFEDLRNSIVQIDDDLSGSQDIITDDNEVDAFFGNAQKQLAGAIPTAIVRNRAGTRVYVPMSATDNVQELVVQGGEFRLRAQGGQVFQTQERPFAVALNEDDGELLVANWGGETLQRFDIATGVEIATIDLGYAQPRYPATFMELGEYTYQTAKWTNDGRKSCASCHYDELLTDGVDYANGATAPTMPHQVKPNYNLMETDNYFWNGSFVNNSYASLAFAAQARTNCELVLFSLVEGIDSNPEDRVGDPNNFTANAAQDAACRPDVNNISALDGLPGSLEGGTFVETIAPIIAQQKIIAGQQGALAVQDQLLRAGAQVIKEDVSRSMDFYGAAELRLPPNALAQMNDLGMLSSTDSAKITRGQQLFNQAGCQVCHDPNNGFKDDADHGTGAGWVAQFIQTYQNDDVLLDVLEAANLPRAIPEQMQFSRERPTDGREINYHHFPLDFFQPFCFDDANCLVFDDPLNVQGQAEEDQRLRRLAQINLADPERGFMPGQPLGATRVNTPSLRGVWMQHNLLRHGLALSIKEAIVPPGHASLDEGQIGWAANVNRDPAPHGDTENMSPDDIDALVLYVQSIE